MACAEYFARKIATISYVLCFGIFFPLCYGCSDDECRMIIFKEPIPDKEMRGHVIRKEEVPNQGSCRVLCFMEPNCVSINVGPIQGGKYKCELNNATEENQVENVLHTKRNFIFLGIENPCSSSPCMNNGVCQVGYTAKGFRCKCRPPFAGEHCAACIFDFENGIDDWEKTGTVFNNQPTFGDNPTARNRGQPANQQGDWWIGGYEDRPSEEAKAGDVQGDSPQGTLTSPRFRIVGKKITFLIGGGCSVNEVRAELIVNDQVVRKETGDCTETMDRKSWDVQNLIGQHARVRLVDESSAEWGHINFDDLRGDISCEDD
ncbi:hypothetical protein ACROYT_G022099 [Oculina patagonica]